MGDAVFGHPGHGNRGEGLVALEEVDVVDRHARLLQGIRGGRDGAGQHENRIVTSHADVVDACPGCEAVVGYRLLRGHQQSRRPVAGLAG